MRKSGGSRVSETVTVIGSANIDLIGRVPHLPSDGETVLGDALARAAGGKGANQAVAAARAGSNVFFVGRVGEDDYGAEIVESLTGAGVATSHLTVDPRRPTGVALILVDDVGRNMIAVLPGTNSDLTEHDVDSALPAIEASRVVVTQLEIPLEVALYGAKMAKRAGAIAILNPAPARELSLEQLRMFEVVVPNTVELGRLSGLGHPNDPAAGAQLLVDAGVKAVVVTLGAEGALVVTESEQVAIPPFPVRAVDTVGAGDAFVGNLAHGLAENQSLAEAARFASAAAALSVEQMGAQPSMPTRAQTEHLLREAE